MQLFFDIETNGYLDTADKVWCIETKDVETGEKRGFSPDNIEEGLCYLLSADTLIGHNILCFDLPILEKLYPWFKFSGQTIDTLNCSRLIWTDLKTKDILWLKKLKDQGVEFDFSHYDSKGRKRSLIGSHSLRAWGVRLGVLKGSYGNGDSDCWEYWTQEMQDYCSQDVDVTEALYKKIKQKNYSETSIWLECEFQKWIFLMEQAGWDFDKDATVQLYSDLMAEKLSLLKELQSCFPPKIIPFTPKVNNSRYGYKKGETVFKEVPFNPDSSDHIAECLIQKYGWKPVKFTNTGKPEVSSDILESLDYPEAKLLIKYIEVQKVLGKITGWLKHEKNGKVHVKVLTNGTPTGRCTHRLIVNVPRVKKDKQTGQLIYGSEGGYGADMRSKFIVPDDPEDPWVLMGVDASSLELRCLAHYLAAYDNGNYIQVVTTGDPHQVNQEAAGLPTRDDAKKFIYALIYGAGDSKIGQIIGKDSKSGGELRKRFLNRTPGFSDLLHNIRLKIAVPYRDRFGKVKWRLKPNAYLKGLDGRQIIVSSEHSALNYLLQSAGAILVKLATVFFCQEMSKQFVWGKDWAMVGHYHDEIQVLVRQRIVEDAKQIALNSFKRAGEFFHFRCPIEGDVKIGKNWAETH